MKQKDLKETESKEVMLATYSMASEGFDCKALNTDLKLPIFVSKIAISLKPFYKTKHSTYFPKMAVKHRLHLFYLVE